REPFDEPIDGIVYGVAASLGFGALENLLAVNHHGIATAFVRVITAVPAHAMNGVVMGAFVGRATLAPREARPRLVVLGFGGAVLLHGAYDTVARAESWGLLL